MRPICVKCQRFFRPKKTGTYFVEGMTWDEAAEPGTAEPEKWQPYKLWAGDKYECEGCGAVIIVGVARDPIAEHYQPRFAAIVKEYGAELQVNDV